MRWTLLDFILVGMFLVALFGMGMTVRVMRDMEEMTKSEKAVVDNPDSIPLKGNPP